MSFTVHYVQEAVHLYWSSYILLFSASVLLLTAKKKTRHDRGIPGGIDAFLFVSISALYSFVSLLAYYALIYSNFRNWTDTLSIPAVLQWMDYVEAGEVVVKFLGLIISVAFVCTYCNEKWKRLVTRRGENIGLRAVLELSIVVLISTLLCYGVDYWMSPYAGLSVVGSSGAFASSKFLTLLVAIVVILGAEVYFRRILLELALNRSGPIAISLLLVAWAAAVLFHTTSWPLVLVSAILQGGAVLLYARWRSLILCICYDLAVVLLSLVPLAQK